MRRTLLVSVLLALALVLIGAAMTGCKPVSSQQLTGVPGSTPKAAGDPAKKAVCLSNEKVFEGQVQTWSAANPGAAVPTSLGELTSQGVVSAIPKCPNGGDYTWDGASLTCSVDGHWQ